LVLYGCHLYDNGDATAYILLGAQAESGKDVLAGPPSEEETIMFTQIRKRMQQTPGFFTRQRAAVRGVTEETTTGINRLYQLQKKGFLPFPAINIDDSVTKSKFENKYGCKESLVDGIRRGTDVMMAGKTAVICGCGDVAMKDMCIIGNIGHFDNEIQIATLRNLQWINIKPQVDMVIFPDGKHIILLSEGRLLNLVAMPPVTFHLSCQLLSPTRYWRRSSFSPGENTIKTMFMCYPCSLMKRWPGCILTALASVLPGCHRKQAAYIGVSSEGPFKPRHYRY